MVLSHPYLDGNPSSRLFVSHVYNPSGSLSGTDWNHPLSVEYDSTLARWTIKNADNATMATGVGFNFRVDPTATQVCVPQPSTGAEFTSTLVVNDSNSNYNNYATLIVTPVSGPAHPVAVKYAAPYWGIVYSDGTLLSAGTCFNVKIIAFSQYVDDPGQPDLSGKSNTIVDNGVGQDMGPTNHTFNGIRIFNFNWSSERSDLQMIYTSNLTPMGFRAPASPDTKYSSLWFTPSCPSVYGKCTYRTLRECLTN